MTFGKQAGHAWACRTGKGNQHFKLACSLIGRGINAGDFAFEALIAIAIDAKAHRLAQLHASGLISRHAAYQAQAGGIDHLEQFFTNRGGVARGGLTLTDNTVKWRTHLGALELLTRQCNARVGARDLVLR